LLASLEEPKPFPRIRDHPLNLSPIFWFNNMVDELPGPAPQFVTSPRTQKQQFSRSAPWRACVNPLKSC
jgi:hypothetical protein